MGKYDGFDNYGRPKTDYIARLAGMTEAELAEETRDMIWLSAFASNNARSDYHWQVDACYDEWKRRGKTYRYEQIWQRWGE